MTSEEKVCPSCKKEFDNSKDYIKHLVAGMGKEYHERNKRVFGTYAKIRTPCYERRKKK